MCICTVCVCVYVCVIFSFILSDDSQRARDITRSLAKMIVTDLQPVSMVEDAGFHHFMKAVDPRYNIPVGNP